MLHMEQTGRLLGKECGVAKRKQKKREKVVVFQHCNLSKP